MGQSGLRREKRSGDGQGVEEDFDTPGLWAELRSAQRILPGPSATKHWRTPGSRRTSTRRSLNSSEKSRSLVGVGCRRHRPRLVLRLPQHHGRREGPGRSTHRENRDPDPARRCSPHPGRCGRSEPGLVSPRPTSRSPAPAECSPSPSARSSESKPPPFTGKKPQPRPHRPPRHLHRRRVRRKVCCRTSSVTSTPSTKPHPPPVSPKPASPLSLSVGSPVRRRPLPAAAALGRHPRRDRHRRHAARAAESRRTLRSWRTQDQQAS